VPPLAEVPGLNRDLHGRDLIATPSAPTRPRTLSTLNPLSGEERVGFPTTHALWVPHAPDDDGVAIVVAATNNLDALISHDADTVPLAEGADELRAIIRREPKLTTHGLRWLADGDHAVTFYDLGAGMGDDAPIPAYIGERFTVCDGAPTAVDVWRVENGQVTADDGDDLRRSLGSEIMHTVQAITDERWFGDGPDDDMTVRIAERFQVVGGKTVESEAVFAPVPV
jgi:hypothetical protein